MTFNQTLSSKYHIGLDFDNTIVLYNEIFYEYALANNHIKRNTERTKSAVRKQLILNNEEHLFTEMQGIVYGELIKNAPVQQGFIHTLEELSKMNYKISQLNLNELKRFCFDDCQIQMHLCKPLSHYCLSVRYIRDRALYAFDKMFW